MYEILNNYCRLCAKNNEENKNTLNPEDTFANLCKTIEKHFSIQIKLNDQAPTTICDECKEFLLKLIDFEEVVIRSQTKFQTIEIKQEEDVGTSIDEKSVHSEESFDENQVDTLPKVEIGSTFTCFNCNKTYKSQKCLNKHIKLLCKSKEVSCDICGNEYKNRSNLLSHQRAVHLNARRYVCDECGKTFKASSDLSRHKEFHRDDDDTPFACKICNKRFKSKLVVVMHEKNHGDNRCSCPICGLELKTKNTLRGHMLMHSEELQFECEICEKKFRHKKNLSVHRLTHSGLQPYTCAFCKKSFSLRFNLRTHQKKMHPEETADYEQQGKEAVITNVVKKKFACGQRESKNSNLI